MAFYLGFGTIEFSNTSFFYRIVFRYFLRKSSSIFF